MPMSKLAQKAVAAITKLQPDPSEGYLAQRKAEDAAGKLTVASPRCRIDNLTVTADDGYAIPCRVLHPARCGLFPAHGAEGGRGLSWHHPVPARRRLGQWRRGLLQRCLHAYRAEAGAARGGGGVSSQSRIQIPSPSDGLLQRGLRLVCKAAAARRAGAAHRADGRFCRRKPGRCGGLPGPRPGRLPPQHYGAAVPAHLQ